MNTSHASTTHQTQCFSESIDPLKIALADAQYESLSHSSSPLQDPKSPCESEHLSSPSRPQPDQHLVQTETHEKRSFVDPLGALQ